MQEQVIFLSFISDTEIACSDLTSIVRNQSLKPNQICIHNGMITNQNCARKSVSISSQWSVLGINLHEMEQILSLF